MIRQLIIAVALLMALVPRPEAQTATAQIDLSAGERRPQETVAPYAVQYEGQIIVKPDRTATEIFTRRVKILAPSALQAAGQQQIFYVEGMETLDTLEAFTEKADGRRIDVDPANIITRDAASGLQTTYMPDR